MSKPVIAITMGDPTGIGPEIISKALSEPEIQEICRPLVLGDRLAMESGIAASIRDLRIETVDALPPEAPEPGVVYLREISGLTASDLVYGMPTPATGDAMYRYILTAAELCMNGMAAAMTTAPICKEAMNRGGHFYPGHTELLAELTGTDEFVMMLAGSRLRVALVTIHEPLAEVPGLITYEKVLTTIKVTNRDISRYFNVVPRIAVAALNPHCGESGMFGREDENIIRPAVEEAIRLGINAVGPLSADTLFHFAVRGDFDSVVCMYHDQGLIPLKLLHFDDGVNITLGLPIIRTSVDHGTAYDLAGKGIANHASMVAAISMASSMAENRRLNLLNATGGKG
jgi:4-hydroxythreonine-4-phosphate dehydrogenase